MYPERLPLCNLLCECSVYGQTVKVIKPLRMCKIVTVVYLSVCVSVNALTARVMIPAIQTWHYQNRHGTCRVFDSWILLKWLCLKVMLSFNLRWPWPYMYCPYSTRIRIMTRNGDLCTDACADDSGH